ncbi:restriction endonuclease subunit S [Duganella sp. LjRoot269]|uniref:restriction endonuclease subunit S n=1 Tax=Duganella sp. LjRoot269 TaxID=3342305 RepID=UPI003ECCE73C
MKGLEALEIPLSSLERTMRLDAEYFAHEHVRVAAQLAKLSTEPITDLAGVSDGNHFSVSADFVDEGIPYYRGQDVASHFFVEQASPNLISNESFKRPYMTRSHLKRGDVLLSIVGTIGKASIVSEEADATCSCKLAILRPRKVKPEYLAAFLRTSQGNSQIRRNTRGAVQMGLLLADMDQIQVPRLSEKFESAISSIVVRSKDSILDAAATVEKSSDTLMNALGLENWNAPEPLSYACNLSFAFSSARLDAEFQQPKYQAIFEELSARFDVELLGKLGAVLKGFTVPYTEGGQVPIIRSGDLSDLDDESRFLRAAPDEAIFELQRGDVLISCIGFGSIGKVQVFDKPGRYGTVSEVTVIRQNKINPYYLAAFFRSKPGQMQIERYITGATGQLHLYAKDVAKFWIPILPNAEQVEFERIEKSVSTSIMRSAELLEVATRAIEIAIETDESQANKFIKAS